jgi:hypothetical protein
MVLLGDILTVLAIFFVGGITLWGCLVACGLLYPDRVRVAHERIADRPGKTFLAGLVVLVTLGTLAALLSAAPPAPVKLIGTAMLLALICLSFLGSAGVALMAATSIGKGAPDLPPYAQLSRGVGYLVLASSMPLVGWFFVGPIVFIMGLGAGWAGALARVRA